ncbi:MAG: hypothetical protein KF799_16115 [Bdellovibrionales bacterium]|nr:hypothetical protein [Bdellovibrionales bacterium]
MKKIILLFVVAATSLTATAAEIRFPYQPRWNVHGYLMHFLAKVPLSQFAVNASGNEISVSGYLFLDLNDVPETIRGSVDEALRETMAGRLEVSGALINATAAQVRYSTDTLTYSSELPELQLALVDSPDFRQATQAQVKRTEPEVALPLTKAHEEERTKCESILYPHLFQF